VGENSSRPRAGTGVALRGIAWMALSTGAQISCQLLVIALLARLISPAEFGLVAAANVVIGMLQFIAVGGIGSVVAQRPSMDSVQVRVAFTLSVATGLALFLLSQLAANWVARFYGIADVASICRALSFAILIQSIGIVGEQLLARSNNFSTLAKIVVLSYDLG
jgi:O-antigen/teichoic acid export membrane protein